MEIEIEKGLIDTLEKSTKNFNKEDLIYTFAEPEWIIENSLYMDNKKKFCSYNRKVIELAPRQFDALYSLAKEPNKPQFIDEFSYDNERQIVRRITRAFRKAGFQEQIITKTRGSKNGFRINTKAIPEMFIITK